MARPRRWTPGGYVYHVCNRGSRKGVLFDTCEDYRAFFLLMRRACEKVPMRIIAYCLMRTHLHFLLWPPGDDDVPRFMQWLSATHARHWHERRGTVGTGAVYQSRYVSVPISDGQHYFTALQYVERNALQAGLVTVAEHWPWGSASTRRDVGPRPELSLGPYIRPQNWLEILNRY